MTPSSGPSWSSSLTRLRVSGDLCLVPMLRPSRPLRHPLVSRFPVLEDTPFPSAWLFPPPTSYSAPGKNRFNPQ